MKNATHELEFALTKYQGIEAIIPKERKLVEECATEQQSLERTIDLFDRAAVQRLTHLLTISQVGLTRRSARMQELEAAKTALVDACDCFSRTVLLPRCQQLESRAFAKVEQKLKPLFPNNEALRSAARSSTELSELAPILEHAARAAHDYSEGIARHAKLLLDASAAADAFEQRHLS